MKHADKLKRVNESERDAATLRVKFVKQKKKYLEMRKKTTID